MTEGPLRFVLLADDEALPAWQAKCLRRSIDSGQAKLVGLVLNSRPSGKPGRGVLSRLVQNRAKILWRLFNRLYVNLRSRATKPVCVADLFEGISVMRDHPLRVGKFAEALTDGTIAQIAALKPDFILRFGFGILKGSILKSAPLGVWSYHHGDPNCFRGQPPGFWEIYHKSPKTGSVLQVISEELDGGLIIQSGQFRTIGHSYAKTRDLIYFGSAPWVAKACQEFRTGALKISELSPPIARGEVFREPENREMAVFFCKTIGNFGRMIRDYKLSRQSWNIGVIDAPIHEVAGLLGRQRSDSALSRVKWMPEVRGSFKADPFGFVDRESGRLKVLFEHYDWSTNLGQIRAVEFDGEVFTNETVALSALTHMSYPYVVSEGSQIYFIPEHSAARDVSAFAIDDKGVAQSKRTIFKRSEMIDTTFVKWRGKHWAFSIINDQMEDGELNIFHADSLWGPWRAHLSNPVKVDVSAARPAGTPFVHDGMLYRPAQDCSSNYGSAVVVNLVEKLTETEFSERAVYYVKPPNGSAYDYGLHTLSSAGGFTLIDGSKRKGRFAL